MRHINVSKRRTVNKCFFFLRQYYFFSSMCILCIYNRYIFRNNFLMCKIASIHLYQCIVYLCCYNILYLFTCCCWQLKNVCVLCITFKLKPIWIKKTINFFFHIYLLYYLVKQHHSIWLWLCEVSITKYIYNNRCIKNHLPVVLTMTIIYDEQHYF